MDFAPTLYHYLDRDGIDSLYAQTVPLVESTFKESVEKSKGGKITGKAALGQALMGFLKLGEAGIEAEHARSRRNTAETTYSLSTEQKLRRIREYLENYRGNFFFNNLKEAAKHCNDNGKPAYIFIQARFNAPQFCPGAGDFGAVQKERAVIFEIGEPSGGKVYYDTYEEADSYYKELRVRLVMIASLDKFQTMRGYTSHAAAIFRRHNGKGIPLGVFGYLMSHGKLFFQIKPFAIWT